MQSLSPYRELSTTCREAKTRTNSAQSAENSASFLFSTQHPLSMNQAMYVRIALYGSEVVRLKKHAVLVSEIAERLSLPEVAVDGAARLTITAGRRALIENHRGLLEFDAERIVVRTEAGRLILFGTAFEIKGMDHRDMLIVGKLQHAEWERGQ